MSSLKAPLQNGMYNDQHIDKHKNTYIVEVEHLDI